MTRKAAVSAVPSHFHS